MNTYARFLCLKPKIEFNKTFGKCKEAKGSLAVMLSCRDSLGECLGKVIF